MATLNDVAKRANVSKMTVSRVINHPEKVSQELRDLVYRAMDDLNYRPNRIAKALATQKMQIIKLIILEEMTNVEPYYMNLITGISKQIDEAGYGLQLMTSLKHDSSKADGYIITGMREKDYPLIQQIQEPIILFGENHLGLDFVDIDNQQSIENAFHIGMASGYENIVLMQMNVDEPFANKREAGYKKAALAYNMSANIIRLDNDSEQATNYIDDHIDHFPGNTLFICTSDRLALGVVRGLIMNQKNVPQDFGVIGHDGVFLDRITWPKLSTMKQPITDMGMMCAKLLIQKIENPDLSVGANYFHSKFISRQTTKES